MTNYELGASIQGPLIRIDHSKFVILFCNSYFLFNIS